MSPMPYFLGPSRFEEEDKNREAFILNLILWVLVRFIQKSFALDDLAVLIREALGDETVSGARH